MATAFSLFADLAKDLTLATRVFGSLWPERVSAVTDIRFEYSPGRGSEIYTADRTAFDVYVEHATPRGGRGFVGIEVKYHEALNDTPAKHRPRYDEITRRLGCFRQESLEALRRKPLEQIWRDHMLLGSMLLANPTGWETGLYVFLYPEDNEACRRATERYREALSDTLTFDTVTLEAILLAIERQTQAEWPRAIRERYLGWEKVEGALRAPAPGLR